MTIRESSQLFLFGATAVLFPVAELSRSSSYSRSEASVAVSRRDCREEPDGICSLPGQRRRGRSCGPASISPTTSSAVTSRPPHVEADVDLAASLSPRFMHVAMENPFSLVGRTLGGIAQLMG